jgi:hypothetical protein
VPNAFDYIKVIVLRNVECFAFLFFVLLSASVMANESVASDPANENTAVWVNAGMLSHHFDQNRNFREENFGLGVEFDMTDKSSITGGYFRNSEDRHSNYLGLVWKPWAIGPIKIGFFGAIVNGYPEVNNGGLFPMALPVATFEYHLVGVNFFIIPKISDRVAGAYVAQFKLRVW